MPSDSDGWLTRSWAAALVKPPASTAATKYSSMRNSITIGSAYRLDRKDSLDIFSLVALYVRKAVALTVTTMSASFRRQEQRWTHPRSSSEPKTTSSV